MLEIDSFKYSYGLDIYVSQPALVALLDSMKR